MISALATTLKTPRKANPAVAKPKKLSLAKAFKYYKAGFPDDGMATLDWFKKSEIEEEALRNEMTAVVSAPTLKEACEALVNFGYGVEYGKSAKDWRSHVESAAAIRWEAGHFELDYSPKSIVKDLLELVQTLGEEVEGDSVNMGNVLRYTGKELDTRIKLVYGRVWED